jgi:uncharacterized phage protein gp47/JayE
VTTASPVERHFPIRARGAIREELLTNFRYGLRQLINPDTESAFTDNEIALATNEKSEAWIRADALDGVLFVNQQRGLWLSQQVRPDRANTQSLKTTHGALWGESFLPASGGSGPATSPCNPDTVVLGSTTIGDPTAMQLTDPTQKRYQVLYTVQAGPSDTSVGITVVGIDTGPATNLEAGTKLRWVNGPLGAGPEATVTAKFTGGLSAETDAQFAARLMRRIRHKPGAGNRAQVRGWAEQAANNAVESAFVYCCAFHAGSTLVAITQKRGDIQGPTGRIASAGTLAAVTAYLAPPGSPVMPVPPRLVVVTPTGVSSDLVLSLAMPTGTSSGWNDLQPWPGQVGGTPTTISAVNVGGDPLAFRIDSPVELPTGITTPQMMIWDDETSRFEQLAVQSVALNAGTIYDVELAQAPEKTLVVGDVISPFSSRALLLASTIEAYFDALGPGELIDVSPSSGDSRRGRAFRFPKPNEEYPQRAGTGVLSFLQDALGASLSDSVLESISVSTPPLPSDIILGPRLLVAGKIGLYSL